MLTQLVLSSGMYLFRYPLCRGYSLFPFLIPSNDPEQDFHPIPLERLA
jgi:hypothetical protein